MATTTTPPAPVLKSVAETPVVAEVPAVEAPKKPHALKGRKPNEAQMAALRTGMEALKVRREAITQAKEDGTFNPDDFKPKAKVRSNNYTRVDPALKPTPRDPPVYVPRKKQVPKATTAEIAEMLKQSVDTIRAELAQPKEIIKEIPVEKIVEKVVERERVVTGREMLDKIFNFK